jgi:hypothetical protein
MSRKHYITVTREVHRALAKHAIGQFNDRDAIYHAGWGLPASSQPASGSSAPHCPA